MLFSETLFFAMHCYVILMPLIYFRVAMLDGNETVNPEVKQNFSKNSSLHIYIPCYDGQTMNLSSQYRRKENFLLVNML